MVETRKHRSKADRAKILIVDDHPIVREHLGELINQQKDMKVCGEAEDGHTAMTAVKDLKPDLAIVDLSLKNAHGIDLVKDLKVQYPDLPVLVLSMHDESVFAGRVLRAGARGYITKQEPTEKVMEAIRHILDGNVYLSEAMSAKVLKRMSGGQPGITPSPMETLTDRELEVFQLIGEGHGTREVADALRLDVKTVETYRARIKEKLNLPNAAILVQEAVRWVEEEGGR